MCEGKIRSRKISTGELVYTGVLRNNLATIVDRVHYMANGIESHQSYSPSPQTFISYS